MESIRRESSRLSRQSVGSKGSHGKSGSVSNTVGGQSSGRPSLLSKAYNSVSYRSSRIGNRASVLSSKLSATTSSDVDGEDSLTTDGAHDTARPLRSFSGVFPVPEPGCKPAPPDELTNEQEQKYADALSFFRNESQYPVSLKADDKRREPLTDWEKLRMLSRESILRYLRATKWDVKAAEKRLIDTIAWRREFGIEDLDPDEMAKEAKSGKETVLGYDNRARPLHYMHPHRNDTKESPRQMQFAVWILERCIDMMPPGVEQLALLINFEHRSRNPTSIANAKLMLYILQNHYVERLGIALCINVPWVFKMFWNAIQAFIDPVTKSKCRFDEAVKSEVPLSQLSADFGGDLDATYNHDSYWPELVKVSAQRRKDMLRRFQEQCNAEIGASEWVIRGGDDPTSLFNRDAAAAQKGEITDASHGSDSAKEASEAATSNNVGAASVGTSTDNSSTAAPAETHDSTPLERFKTPTETLNRDPLERTFSTTSTDTKAAAVPAAAAASTSLETTTEKPKEEEEEAQKTSEEGHTSSAAGTAASKKHPHTNVFKEMDKKLHASKLFAAFHPDSHRSSQDRARSPSSTAPSDSNKGEEATRTGPTEKAAPAKTPSSVSEEVSSPRSENVPSAHEIVAVAGTAGPTAAAGAIGSMITDQARTEIARVKSTASGSLAQLTAQPLSPSKETDVSAMNVVEAKVINVLFFAAAKDAIGGKGRQQMAMPSTAEMSLSALRDHLLAVFKDDPPSDKYDGEALRKVIQQSKWSVDESMIDEEELDSTVLRGGEDVAIIPPVSGG